MALINISAEIKGESKTTAQTIRRLQAVACLKGVALSTTGRRQPSKENEEKSTS